MTLQSFVQLHLTQEKAARTLDVPLNTLGRWLRGETRPRGEYVKMLLRHGIEWGGK